MKFRFRPEDFDFKGDIKAAFEYHPDWISRCVADIANARLEAEEAKCEMVYADCRTVHRKWYDDKTGMGGKFGIQALLWSVEEIMWE